MYYLINNLVIEAKEKKRSYCTECILRKINCSFELRVSNEKIPKCDFFAAYEFSLVKDKRLALALKLSNELKKIELIDSCYDEIKFNELFIRELE
ncbi:hypothetical protein [Cetobacterium sp.]|uniref:hypothetical protein n=1 Tax=Cetobacterium sp. TaxID=2071632 RepID=UPI003F36E8EF